MDEAYKEPDAFKATVSEREPLAMEWCISRVSVDPNPTELVLGAFVGARLAVEFGERFASVVHMWCAVGGNAVEQGSSSESGFRPGRERNRMGSAAVQGELWGKAPRDWAELQEVQHRPLWEAMLDAGNVGPGTRFLDAGCGGGGASVLAAQRGSIVSGLDAAETLIEIAREQVPDGDFRVGDIQHLPFADQTFDTVMAASSLQYSEDRVATLREMKRVSARGGKVVLGLWSVPNKVEYRVVFAAVRDALPKRPPGKGPFELSEPGVLEDVLEQAGMNVLSSGEARCPFDYASYETFWRANVSAGPLQGAMQSAGEEKLEKAVRDAVRPYQASDGSIHMENWFRYVVAAS